MAQRRRWEHGYLRTAIVQIPRLLLAAARQRRLELAWMALDLSIPPLALLAILWLAAFAAAAALRALTWAPLALLGAGGAAAFVSIGVAWFAFCRREVSAASLCAAPFYVIRKLPIYSALLVRRQKEWVRTERRPASTRLNRAAEDTP